MKEFNLADYPLWTALVTPFKENGEVHYDDLEKLLNQQEQAGNGILILGSTGEALNLNLETRKNIIDFCCSKNLDVPLMAGVGGALIQETTEWVEWLNNQSLHSLLLVTPLYSKPGRQGQTTWFKNLLDAAKLPCVLYNVPGRTGVDMKIDTVKDLVDHPNFWGIKEASGSVEKFKEYCNAATGKKMFCGDDGLMPEFTQAGGHGLISVASNVWPAATHEYVRQNLNGKFTDHDIWRNAADSMFLASNPIPAKRLLAERGDITSATLQLPLIASELESISPVMEQNDLINQWFEKQNA